MNAHMRASVSSFDKTSPLMGSPSFFLFSFVRCRRRCSLAWASLSISMASSMLMQMHLDLDGDFGVGSLEKKG
jgi:hypothetical protein